MQAAFALRNGTLEALVALVEEVLPKSWSMSRHGAAQRSWDGGWTARASHFSATWRPWVARRRKSSPSLREQAIPNVKGDLALRSVADAVGIEPSESELDNFIDGLARQAGVPSATSRNRSNAEGSVSRYARI